MGKYPKGAIGLDKKTYYLKCIANELAEANRLKRFELSDKHESYDLGDDGLKYWTPSSHLEDKA